ncbi:hypothetical protein EV13_0762 [Prochlorococcus sp. MIT 0702]|nr:hypothetical protein EV12_0280 [Prochlorococcus sp. MIT 0701]KGG29958.1 hypothetical protein EV13_0762 [Prochlorococcus sp. MIT 0702]KGG36960.1 hypothetical protein EV14_0170 [Prochlorococcus sp. MIT 0703]
MLKKVEYRQGQINNSKHLSPKFRQTPAFRRSSKLLLLMLLMLMLLLRLPKKQVLASLLMTSTRLNSIQ